MFTSSTDMLFWDLFFICQLVYSILFLLSGCINPGSVPLPPAQLRGIFPEPGWRSMLPGLLYDPGFCAMPFSMGTSCCRVQWAVPPPCPPTSGLTYHRDRPFPHGTCYMISHLSPQIWPRKTKALEQKFVLQSIGCIYHYWKGRNFPQRGLFKRCPQGTWVAQ